MSDFKVAMILPTLESTTHRTLALRIASAYEEIAQPVKLCTIHDLRSLLGVDIVNYTLLLIMPSLYVDPDKSTRFLSDVAGARKRIIVTIGALEDRSYSDICRLPIEYDAHIDVGFAPQVDKVLPLSIPYYFLLNGPTQSEVSTLQRETSAEHKSVSWATVGTMSTSRAQLLSELVNQIDPSGFVFMPKANVPQRKPLNKSNHWQISDHMLTKVLKMTRYYVWCSKDGLNNYESHRFITSLVAGAVPCRVGKYEGVPCTFPSVGELRKSINQVGYDRMFAECRDFYLSQRLLSESLEVILNDIA